MAFFAPLLQAQTDSLASDTVLSSQSIPGEVRVHGGERLLALLDTLTELSYPLEGFRIQLAFGKKDEVNELRTEFLKAYPALGAYISWLQPNFRLRIGDFRTRLQAERFKQEIQETYPGCYIVRDIIEFSTDENDLD